MALNHRHAFSSTIFGALRHPSLSINTLPQAISDGRRRWGTVGDDGLGTKVGANRDSPAGWQAEKRTSKSDARNERTFDFSRSNSKLYCPHAYSTQVRQWHYAFAGRRSKSHFRGVAAAYIFAMTL